MGDELGKLERPHECRPHVSPTPSLNHSININSCSRIVENGYESALIMEDDMDWDVRLKSQFIQFIHSARYIQSSSFPSSLAYTSSSPYGNNWDLIWLGHCGEVFPETLP